MQGHNEDLGLDATLRLRLEPELKVKVAALAKRRRQTASQLLREKLWQIVEAEEKALAPVAELAGGVR